MYDHSYYLKAWLSAATLPFWLVASTFHDASRLTEDVTRSLGAGALRSAATMLGTDGPDAS